MINRQAAPYINLFQTNLLHSERERSYGPRSSESAEAVVHRCSSEYVFLKISQISQENTYVGVSLK